MVVREIFLGAQGSSTRRSIPATNCFLPPQSLALRNLRVEIGFCHVEPTAAVRRAFKGENVVTMKLGGVGATLSGCNTSEGFGKDVESVGEDIQDEAREAK